MVSMKDISNACHVSVATVSKALNDRGDISKETKERICQIAKEMGYLPNSSARALKTNRSYNLGVLFADEARSGLTHSYFSHVLESFRQEAEKNGYDITFINNRANDGTFSYYEHSRYRGVDGVVIACVNFESEEVQELMNGDLPVVTIDYVINNQTCILSDNVQGMEELVSYIIACGHTKIAYIHGADSAVTQNRIATFRHVMEKHGIEVPASYIKEGVYHAPEVSAGLTEELLSLQERPTCIIYPDDFSCFGGINVIQRSGMKIPQDISVAGYDGQRIAQVIEPRITTYKQNTEELGRLAAKKLIERIEKPESSVIERVAVKGKLIRGKSVRRWK